ncbi:MAG: transporter substrate-binding domain-containing protein [Candidatus Izimaplasma sp.]|nr:transporter substrate-binding domain-containing protein [Candidatus Izimaplasma bacterium]
MKKIIFSFMVLFLGVLLISCNTSSNVETSTEARETLVVGMEAAYAPFNWTVSEANAYEGAVPIDGTNNYVDGYDVMIASYVASELDMDLVIKAVEWEGLIPSLVTSREIDLIIAGMSPTAERAETVSFTSEYYQSTHVVVLRSDSEFAYATSIADFSGADVVAQMSTIYDSLVVQLTGANHLDPLGDVPTIVTAIKQGTYDLTILELPVALALVESNPELTYIEFSEGNGFDVAYEDSAVAIALRQADSDLLIAINQVLAELSNEDFEAMMTEALSRQP